MPNIASPRWCFGVSPFALGSVGTMSSEVCARSGSICARVMCLLLSYPAPLLSPLARSSVVVSVSETLRCGAGLAQDAAPLPVWRSPDVRILHEEDAGGIVRDRGVPCPPCLRP